MAVSMTSRRDLGGASLVERARKQNPGVPIVSVLQVRRDYERISVDVEVERQETVSFSMDMVVARKLAAALTTCVESGERWAEETAHEIVTALWRERGLL